MNSKYYLSFADYIVIAAFLLISALIGIGVRFYDGRYKSTRDYLLAGRNMSMLPIISSIVVTMTSGTTLLISPVETYRYGLKPIIATLSIPLGMILASYVFMPVYFQCGVSTVNEFLEMRYGKKIRYVMSGLFLIQMVFMMSCSLYAAVLAFSAVTVISLQWSVVCLGCVCAFYCALGGLKGVLWTDVFQALLVVLCLLSLYIVGIQEANGISTIFNRAKEGERLVLFDFQFDFTIRYGFWVCFIRGIIYGFGFYGTNQVEVQRVLSMSNIKRAKPTFQISCVPVLLMYFTCSMFGIVLYSIFYNCDPLLSKEHEGLSKYDQMVPFYIVKKFSAIPGMTGLCMAGIFSASLSSISSALNSATTVTIVDIIQPLFQKCNISDLKSVWLAKLMTLFYGGLSIGLTFCFLNVHSLTHLANTFVTLSEGPSFAVFLVGVLTRKACDKCVCFAMVLGNLITACLSFGSLYSRYSEPPLPLSTSMCSLPKNFTPCYNISSQSCIGNINTTASITVPPKETFILFKISFLWHVTIGFIITLVLIFLAVLVKGWKENAIPEDSKCLSPVTNLWKRNSQKQSQELKTFHQKN